jgi:hypothetical protein
LEQKRQEQNIQLDKEAKNMGFDNLLNFQRWMKANKITDGDKLLNLLGKNDSSLCPSGNLFCSQHNLKESDLDVLNYYLSNTKSGYQIGGTILGVIGLGSAFTGELVLPFIFGVPSLALLYEASALGDLVSQVQEMQRFAHENGGDVDVAFYQGANDLMPGLIYEGDIGHSYIFDTVTGLLIVKNQLGIP